MQVEISERIYTALTKRAEMHHLSVEACLESIVENHMDQADRRKHAIERMETFMRSNTATSGRGSMDWREYIHQGHRY